MVCGARQNSPHRSLMLSGSERRGPRALGRSLLHLLLNRGEKHPRLRIRHAPSPLHESRAIGNRRGRAASTFQSQQMLLLGLVDVHGLHPAGWPVEREEPRRLRRQQPRPSQAAARRKGLQPPGIRGRPGRGAASSASLCGARWES